MNVSEIQARLDAMPTRMSAKGKIKPEASLVMQGNMPASVFVQWYDMPSDNWRDIRSHHVPNKGDISDMFDAADAFIAAMDDPEIARRNQFLRSLADTIELGRANGIELEIVNPLVEAMKRLSENALEDHSDGK